LGLIRFSTNFAFDPSHALFTGPPFIVIYHAACFTFFGSTRWHRTSSSRMSQRSILRQRGVQGFIGLSRQEIHSPRAAQGIRALVTSESTPSASEHCLEAWPISLHQNGAPITEVVDPAEKWKNITVEMWRDAVYTNQTYFGDLIKDTNEFVKNIAEKIKLNGAGCQWWRSGVALVNLFVQMNMSSALQLVSTSIKSSLPSAKTWPPKEGLEGRSTSKVMHVTLTTCLSRNSRMVSPEEVVVLSSGMTREWWHVLGTVFVMVYWNAHWFGDACLNFYCEPESLRQI